MKIKVADIKAKRAAARKRNKQRKAAIKAFTRHHMQGSYPEIELTGVFIDEVDGEKRVVIVAEHISDKEKLEALAREHFSDLPFQITYHDEKGEGLAGKLTTGEGVLREGTEEFGTVGGYFRMSKDQDGNPMDPTFFFGLSNNHVIAAANQGKKGDWLVNSQQQRIGRLYDMVHLDPNDWNGIDAAIFLVEKGWETAWDPVQPTGKTGARIKMEVYKIGAKSGKTKGVVKGIGQLKAKLGGVDYWFEDVISIEGTDAGSDFSEAGDSGSLVMTGNDKMLGLLFYKVGKFAYACPVKHLAGWNLIF